MLHGVSDHLRDDPAAATDDDDVEVVDALPVGAAAAPLPEPERSTGLLPATPVAVQAVAVAATGFVAGAATIAVVRRRRHKKALKRSKSVRRQLGEIAASRSFLVDVHLLSRP